MDCGWYQWDISDTGRLLQCAGGGGENELTLACCGRLFILWVRCQFFIIILDTHTHTKGDVHAFIRHTNTPPPFSASQGHLFLSSPHQHSLSLSLPLPASFLPPLSIIPTALFSQVSLPFYFLSSFSSTLHPPAPPPSDPSPGTSTKPRDVHVQICSGVHFLPLHSEI